jgi:hypothetical protein
MQSFIFMTATVVAVYWFWIRPILKSRPAFRGVLHPRRERVRRARCRGLACDKAAEGA